MGKVLSRFSRGFPGAVTRAHDNVIVSVKNVGAEAIPFGAPVFAKTSSPQGVIGFVSGTTTEDTFAGFACRVADKTPPAADSSEGRFEPGEPVDVLVRGSMCVPCASASAKFGDRLYIRKSDGKLVNVPGSEGSTVPVPNTTIRGNRDADTRVEIVITKRNYI